MEENKYLIVSILAFLLALAWDLRNRNRNSSSSPKRFNLWFYIKDNYERFGLSLAVSIIASVLVKMMTKDIGVALHGQEWDEINMLVYAAIGGAPDLVFSFLKRKYNMFQPDKVNGFDRTNKK